MKYLTNKFFVTLFNLSTIDADFIFVNLQKYLIIIQIQLVCHSN